MEGLVVVGLEGGELELVVLEAVFKSEAAVPEPEPVPALVVVVAEVST